MGRGLKYAGTPKKNDTPRAKKTDSPMLKQPSQQTKDNRQRAVQNMVQDSIHQETLNNIWKRLSANTDMALRVWHSIEAGHMDAVEKDNGKVPKCENKFNLLSRDNLLMLAEKIGLPNLSNIQAVSKKLEVCKIIVFYLNVTLRCALPSRTISSLISLCKKRFETEGRQHVKLTYVPEKPGTKNPALRVDFDSGLFKLTKFDEAANKYL